MSIKRQITGLFKEYTQLFPATGIWGHGRWAKPPWQITKEFIYLDKYTFKIEKNITITNLNHSIKEILPDL